MFSIEIKDIFDILLTAFLMFSVYRLLKRSGVVTVFYGILAFFMAWYVISKAFNMKLLGGILDGIINVGAFALIVLFQTEIKRFFSRIGSTKNWGLLNGLKSFFKPAEVKKSKNHYTIIQIVLACRNLSKTVTGALIVLQRSDDLDFYSQTGERIDAQISSRLLENIFFKNSPLHDGALIIDEGRLESAGCILPVSSNENIPKRLGLRHRSALGITEKTDAIAIVVSEETGHISWAMNGKLNLNVKPEELEQFLSKEMHI